MPMPYLIGTDEAGYGPRLGPLVVSISVWHVEGPPSDVELYGRLDTAITPSKTAETDKIAIADSKVLYKSHGSLAGLERAIFPALSCLGKEPRDWRTLWEVLAGDSGALQQNLPWYQHYNEPLPVDIRPNAIQHLKEQLQSALEKTETKLLRLRSVALFPEQFNRITGQLGSKGATLSTTTLELIAHILDELPPDEALIICDKHGGRNYYLPALQPQFPDHFVEVLCESRALSAYQFGPPEHRIEIRFQVGGESFLPTALASLASKYLRELAMRAFNTYWREKIPQIRPTAGYPADAERMRRDIESANSDFDLPSERWWREK